MTGKLKEYILNIFFPKRCVFCGKLMPFMTETAVCGGCMNELPFCLSYERCKICGKPINGGERECRRCRTDRRRAFTKISAAYIYENDVKKSILRFKRERCRSYARIYAEHIKAVVEYDNKNRKFDIVVSAAPRKKRMKEEGYDQAEVLGLALAKAMNLPFEKNVLKQKENREKQSSLTGDERFENAKGNYAVKKKEAVAGKTVLLVDDISTTGATFKECADVLKKAGAAQVCCAAAATVSEKR